jgi:hypothetical protein
MIRIAQRMIDVMRIPPDGRIPRTRVEVFVQIDNAGHSEMPDHCRRHQRVRLMPA